MLYIWPISAFIASFFSAFYMVSNQYVTLPSWMINWLLRLGLIIILLPLLFIYGFVGDPIFYMAVLATSLLVTYADVVVIQMIQDYGSGPVSRMITLGIPISFILWTIIDPSSITPLLNKPMAGFGIIAALCLATYFIYTLKSCKTSFTVIKRLIPIVILLYSPVDVLNKTAMLHAPVVLGPLYYVLFQSIGVFILLTIYLLYKKRHVCTEWKPIIQTTNIKRNALIMAGIIVFYIGTMFGKNLGMRFTPNPAYVMIMIKFSPLWIVLMNKKLGYADNTDIKSGIGLVVSAVAIVVFNHLAQ